MRKQKVELILNTKKNDSNEKRNGKIINKIFGCGKMHGHCVQ